VLTCDAVEFYQQFIERDKVYNTEVREIDTETAIISIKQEQYRNCRINELGMHGVWYDMPKITWNVNR